MKTCSGKPILLVGNTFQQRNAAGERELVDAETQANIEAIIVNNPNIDIVADDPIVAAQLAEYTSQLEKFSKEVIGQAAEDLLHIRIPCTQELGVELPNGSHIATLVAEAFFQQLKSRNYNPDLVIQNAGGIRNSIFKGDITIETVYTLLSFTNTIYLLELTGAEVKQLLEDALSHHFDNGGSDGSFPYAANIRYTIEINRQFMERVTSLEIKDDNGNWMPIDLNKIYRVGTCSFIAHGKDGFATFGKVLKERGGIDTYFDYAESFVNYVKMVGTLIRPNIGITYIDE
ncbi:protein containing 5'-Nucleotidase [Candidatus Thiomargarita nelsonii]|uniref:Protein containing 5'-Nucleotidase n=1 Tax=Candidatus Thiomargarita nelsonii TaxID=1003181 RepID=A0A176RUQ4_9GAMM|nr:protein containing 5'-Nucleotidase [Candidatus Thiomargarita nelsonii]